MKVVTGKGIGAVLISLGLLTGLSNLPGLSATAQATAPSEAQFATKEQLLTDFRLDGSPAKIVSKIKYGTGNRTWSIAGADGTDTLVLWSTASFGKSAFNYDPSYQHPSTIYGDDSNPSLTSTVKNFLKNKETGTYFSSKELDLMEETTVSASNRKVTGKLYLPGAVPNVSDHFTICVGRNNDIKIVEANWPNVTLLMRTAMDGESVYVANGGPLNSDWPRKGTAGAYWWQTMEEVVPAFDLNVSSVLFASAASPASPSGTTVGNAFTLRYKSTALGSAAINAAKDVVSVSGAPQDTYLVVQNDKGAWSKAVSGNTSVSADQVTIKGSPISSFDGCKVWLETTDTANRITNATMAVQEQGFTVKVTPGSYMSKTADTGTESQIVSAGSPITNIVYTADSGYYFPDDYSVADANGIRVTRDSNTQITVSGTPLANAAITLASPTPKAVQPAPAVSGGVEQIIDATTDMEYAATAAASAWTSCTDVNSIPAGTWYVRYKGTDTKEPSQATKVNVLAATYTITASPADKSFDTEDEGYAQPQPQNVTVTNTGNSKVTLNQPTGVDYDIGSLSETDLPAGSSAVFSVRPKAGLTAGTYNEMLTVATDKGTTAGVNVSFKVNGALSVTVSPDAPQILDGTSQSLTANPIGGSGSYTYAWYAGSGTTEIGTTKEVSETPDVTTTYKVVVNDTIEGKQATATVTVIPRSYTITASEVNSFGTVNEGYTQPGAQTVTITNTGNSELTLNQPASSSYDIGSLSTADLPVGGTATFTVRPKADLKRGSYSEPISVTTAEGTKTNVAVSFTVNAAFSVVISPTNAEIVEGGTQTLTANATGGSGTYTYKWYVQSQGTVAAISSQSAAVPEVSKSAAIAVASEPAAVSETDEFAQTQEVTVSPTESTTYKVVADDTIEKKEAVVTVTVQPKSYSIASSEVPDFGTVNEGYAQPATKTVTITNTGNSDLTLIQPAGKNYEIGSLSSTDLGAGAAATFTVQPKVGLKAGVYNETVTITTDKGVSAKVALSFKVNKAPSAAVSPGSPNSGKSKANPNGSKAQESQNPETGDNSSPLLLFIIMGGAVGVGFAVTIKCNKKRDV